MLTNASFMRWECSYCISILEAEWIIVAIAIYHPETDKQLTYLGFIFWFNVKLGPKWVQGSNIMCLSPVSS